MIARDVMTLAVFTVKPTTSVKDVARLFIEQRISAVPVVDDHGKIVGIVSEGDLVHRSEISTERRHPWWLGSGLIKSTIQERRQGRRRRDNFARAYRSELRCV